MRDLKTIRIILTTIFLAASAAWLCMEPDANRIACIAPRVQLLPSLLSSTIGCTLIWLVLTFTLGRIYCSSVCPIGTLQDISTSVRNSFGLRHVSSYRQRNRLRWYLLGLYAVCLLVGAMGAVWLLEPWNLLKSATGVVKPEAVEQTWEKLAIGGTVGASVSLVAVAAIMIWAFFKGRLFCTDICPVGTLLEAVAYKPLYHIEIDPDKCINCMKCEEVCPTRCIKVVSRYVDDPRCVRCFNCLKVCDNEAINYQRNQNRRGTPLLQRHKELT